MTESGDEAEGRVPSGACPPHPVSKVTLVLGRQAWFNRLRVGKIAVATRISRLACTAVPHSSMRERERERRGENKRRMSEVSTLLSVIVCVLHLLMCVIMRLSVSVCEYETVSVCVCVCVCSFLT